MRRLAGSASTYLAKITDIVQLTDYHAKYFANELTKRCASDSVEKLASVLADAG